MFELFNAIDWPIKATRNENHAFKVSNFTAIQFGK
tara:strand:+ start:910 stop:1014 length:105 start_codon:yes stop_codon:yes gene_type:complete